MTKGKQILNQDRERIVAKYESGQGYKEISTALNINYQTVVRIVKKYTSTGEISVGKRGGNRRSLLNEEEKAAILGWVDQDCTLTLKQIKNKLESTYGKIVSISTADRVLRQFHYSLKRTTLVPERRNIPRVVRSRLEYATAFRSLEEETEDKIFVFLDEVGFCYSTRIKRGRAPIGSSAYVSAPVVRSRNFSVLSAMNKYGMIFCKTQDRPFNGEGFKEGVFEIKRVCDEKGITDPIFILDNATIHKYSGLMAEAESRGLKFMFLPPYSPFLNPIENCFSKWKNFVTRQGANNEAELREFIGTGFNSVTEEDCSGFYRKMIRYINRSLNSEIINE